MSLIWLSNIAKIQQVVHDTAAILWISSRVKSCISYDQSQAGNHYLEISSEIPINV